jgi:peptide/nickel transport system ATP-binding protein
LTAEGRPGGHAGVALFCLPESWLRPAGDVARGCYVPVVVADEGTTLLAVDRLTASFEMPRGTLRPVNDVSFELAAGESLGIVGESGSGKSMLMRTVMNILPRSARVDPDSRIRFEGRDVRELRGAEARHFWGAKVAMIFQDPMTSLNPVRTIGKHITDPLRYHLGLDRRQARDRAAELLALVGINEPARRLKQYPHELSGGMRQRVMIAVAISCSPKLLIADEPTTALDVTVQKEILDLLARLRSELQMSMILISHDLEVVRGRTDRTMVMYAGRVVESGTTSALFTRTRHPYTAALLLATPRIDAAPHTRLNAIPGNAPDLANLPPGCAFAPRCRLSQPRCCEAVPPLGGGQTEDEHVHACFFPLDGVPVSNAQAALQRQTPVDH